MFDILAEIVSAVGGEVFSQWYENQRWWVKMVTMAVIVFLVLAIIYFFFPSVFGLQSSR